MLVTNEVVMADRLVTGEALALTDVELFVPAAAAVGVVVVPPAGPLAAGTAAVADLPDADVPVIFLVASFTS